jgi:hypothetical protein
MGKKRTPARPAMVRQGDVLLVPIGRERDLRRLERVDDPRGVVLAEGEATGHAHRVVGEARLYRRDFWPLWGAPPPSLLVVDREATLVHEEHDAVALAPGQYEVRRQREYDLGRGFLQVAD